MKRKWRKEFPKEENGCLLRLYLDQFDYSTPLHHLLVPLGDTYSQFTNSLAQNIR